MKINDQMLQIARNLENDYLGLSVAFLQRKMKVSHDVAQEIIKKLTEDKE